MNCPVCEDGRIEVATKVYFDVTGTIEDLPNAGATAVIDGIAPSDVNDTLAGVPFNMEAEFFCGCDECGATFPVAWSDELLSAINRQADRND